MFKLGTSGRVRALTLVETSPLRHADPRTKLALSLCASTAVMLPLERLAIFMLVYAALLLWARLLPHAARQAWRLKWVLVGLFVIDWLVVGLDLAVIVTLRLILLAGAFALFVGTTTPSELRLALEWLRVPYRYAFSLSLAFQSVDLLNDEWRAVREAQRARGAWVPLRRAEGGFRLSGWRDAVGEAVGQVRELVALTVPVIVLTTKRAWAMTEAAYARGFEAPHRRSYRRLRMAPLDWLLLIGTAIVGALLLLWRY